jgi:ubiquinone/menaquinone biosynthesis C-methylase UbiE
MTSVQQLYGELWADENGLDSELQRSLDPRGTEWLFAAFAELGPKTGELVVDIGARDAVHSIRLVREHGLKAIALDPVPLHAELARRAVTEAGLEQEVDVVQAGIEAMPLADGSADWIWCRDVLVHVDLSRGLAECGRVLRPGGQMLAYVTCATDSLEPREAAELFDALAIVAESVQPTAIENHAAAAGLTLVSRTPLAGEWRERMIEDAAWDPADDLLRLSRLQRREPALLEQHGATRVAAYAAARRWGVYQLLGKMCPTIYLWQRDA